MTGFEGLPYEVPLAEVLLEIEAADTNYSPRYQLVIQAMYLATRVGFPAGIGFDRKEPDWPVVYIELPTGQVSWHIPMYGKEWDGHSTETKYARCRAYAESSSRGISA